jgi:excisionase family DNA binding protein
MESEGSMHAEEHYSQVAYTVKQAAKLLGLCQESVRHQIRAGNIRAGRMGERYMIPKAEIERVIGQSGRVTP